jgi:hypothetical protein
MQVGVKPSRGLAASASFYNRAAIITRGESWYGTEPKQGSVNSTRIPEDFPEKEAVKGAQVVMRESMPMLVYELGQAAFQALFFQSGTERLWKSTKTTW